MLFEKLRDSSAGRDKIVFAYKTSNGGSRGGCAFCLEV
jgi:hypothetical protein